jgi:hypothetical protein
MAGMSLPQLEQSMASAPKIVIDVELSFESLKTLSPAQLYHIAQDCVDMLSVRCRSRGGGAKLAEMSALIEQLNEDGEFNERVDAETPAAIPTVTSAQSA